jgi:hypothetical protein
VRGLLVPENASFRQLKPLEPVQLLLDAAF